MSRRARILHIEDNPGDAELVAQAFVEIGAEIDVRNVPNAVLAFSFLGKQVPFKDALTPDLVLLDVNLPVISGLKALDIIKTAVEWGNIPVMMLSSTQREAEQHEALAKGALAFLVKPGDWDGYLRLAQTLNEDLQRRLALESRTSTSS